MCDDDDDVWAEQLIAGALGPRDRELDVINELLTLLPYRGTRPQERGIYTLQMPCSASSGHRNYSANLGIIWLHQYCNVLVLSHTIYSPLGLNGIILGLGAFVLDYV